MERASASGLGRIDAMNDAMKTLRSTGVRRPGRRRAWGLLLLPAVVLGSALGVSLLTPGRVCAAAPAERVVAGASLAPAVFEFPSLNRAYRMDDSAVAPVRQGPVTIFLSSPRNSFVLKAHSVTLLPLGDGTYRASVGVDFLGSGDLVADLVTQAGTSSRLEDLVVMPRQQVRLDGRVRFARVAEGWDVTALSLPRQVEIGIQSRLVGNLVTLCGQMAVFLGLDCDGLDRSLSRVEVPLPEPGSVFFLPAGELTPAEAAAFDAFLGLR